VTKNLNGQPQGGSKLTSGFETFLERARNLIINVAVIGGSLVIALSITINGWGGRYSIEPISAPDDFQKNTNNGLAIAALLRDDLNKLVRISGTNVAIKPVGDQKAPEVTVMGTTFSLDYFMGAVRGLIGKQYPRITGEISYSDKNKKLGNSPMLCPDLARSKAAVKLVLRVADDGGVPFFEGEGSFPEVALCGALYTLRIVDPYSAASYLGQRPETQPQALEILDEAAATIVKDKSARPWVDKLYSSSDMAEIDLIRANIKLGNENKQEAEYLFEAADKDYNDRHLGRGGWYPAFDGLATTYLEEGRFKEAVASVDKALELQNDYKSAMFHKAQIFDFQFREERNNESSNKCQMLEHVNRAKTFYDDVVRKYPDMAVAYFNKGLMLLLLDTYWHFHPTAGCVPGDAEYTRGAETIAKHLRDLDREAESNFREAIMLDPEDSNAWLQLGILLMQRQEPGWQKPELLSTDSRRETLNEAIASLNTAEKLKPEDPFIRGRLNEAKAEKEANEAVKYFNASEKPEIDHQGVSSWLKQARLEQEALQ
jgi:tetratricopeptide (TPR) repeat protein